MSVRNMIDSPAPSFGRARQGRTNTRMDKEVCDVLLLWRYCFSTTVGLRSIKGRCCHVGSDRIQSALCTRPARPSSSFQHFRVSLVKIFLSNVTCQATYCASEGVS